MQPSSTASSTLTSMIVKNSPSIKSTSKATSTTKSTPIMPANSTQSRPIEITLLFSHNSSSSPAPGASSSSSSGTVIDVPKEPASPFGRIGVSPVTATNGSLGATWQQLQIILREDDISCSHVTNVRGPERESSESLSAALRQQRETTGQLENPNLEIALFLKRSMNAHAYNLSYNNFMHSFL